MLIKIENDNIKPKDSKFGGFFFFQFYFIASSHNINLDKRVMLSVFIFDPLRVDKPNLDSNGSN